MKNVVALIGSVLLAIGFASDSAIAQEKVVVIPLASAKNLDNVVTVSAKGGDYTDPVAAVNSIIDASSQNPYLIHIGPGEYTLNQTLVMKPYVSITGSGRGTTVLTGSISGSALTPASSLISGASNATLADLTVKNTGGGQFAIALYNNNAAPHIQNVYVHTSGGNQSNNGIVNLNSANATLTNVVAEASGGGQSFGIVNISSAPTLTNVTARAMAGTANYGVFNTSSTASMINVIASATGGGTANNGIYNDSSLVVLLNVVANGQSASGTAYNYGVHNVANVSPTTVTMTNVIATASGADFQSYGMLNVASTAVVRRSTLQGFSGFVTSSGGTVTVSQSTVIGQVATPLGGSATCVATDNGSGDERLASCFL